ncbi:interleukin-1 receptor-associated kinase 4 [Aphomia sociella]
MYKNVELRKLPAGHLCRIADILETNNDWKKVMSLIPKDPLSKTSEPKYNNEHMRLIEDHAKQSNRKCAEILFDEWGTSGRVRPTLNTLNDIILKAEIYRAADEIALIMKESPPARPTKGPAAVVDTDITLLLNDISTAYPNDNHKPNGALNNDSTAQMISTSNIPRVIETLGNKTTAQVKSASDLIKFSQQSMNIPDFNALMPSSQSSDYHHHSDSHISTSNNAVPVINYLPPYPAVDISKIDTTILTNTTLTYFEYKVLETITNGFSDELGQTARGPIGKIGSGGFGDVYVGYHKKFNQLAVKRFRINFMMENKPHVAMKVFNSEVKALSQLRHHNIVPIIGYSADGPSLCVVCEYIDGGSLEANLAERKLNEKHRFMVMSGTADGLKYIHRCEKPPTEDEIYVESASGSKKNNYLHGDVKSANILLTMDYVPKLCDFGLAKHIDNTFITTSLMGTSAYMAPEGFTGTITQKIDIYSYGIVLLELLTGLRPIVVSGSEKINIKNYVEENTVNDDITKLLDASVHNWQQADKVYELARRCLCPQRNDRPTIEEVCDTLYQINLNF